MIGIPFAVAYLGSLQDRRTTALAGNCLAYAAGLALVLVPAFWLLHGPLASTFARRKSSSLMLSSSSKSTCKPVTVGCKDACCPSGALRFQGQTS